MNELPFGVEPGYLEECDRGDFHKSRTVPARMVKLPGGSMCFLSEEALLKPEDIDPNYGSDLTYYKKEGDNFKECL